jgi:predicted O-linked N-acetylglucosamine transferase (SPINDLY family)
MNPRYVPPPLLMPTTPGAGFLAAPMGLPQFSAPVQVEESLDSVLGRMDLNALLAQVDQLRSSGQGGTVVPLYRRWLASSNRPDRYVAWFNLGVELSAKGDPAGAAQAYREALALNPTLIEAQLNLGNSLETLGQVDDALACWQRALDWLLEQPIARLPLIVVALNNLGRANEDFERYEQAEAFLLRSLQVQPAQPDVLQHWFHLRQKQCRWPVEALPPGVTAHALRMAVSPLAVLAAYDDPAMQMLTSRNFVARKFGKLPSGNLGAKRLRGANQRLRIGYLSGDFCTHAVGLLLPDFLESHDKSRVETFGFCWSPEDGSQLRQRLKTSFDHFERIDGLDDTAAAERIAAAGIDVLVDLHGLSSGVRPGILALRPAPAQVEWLGYMGPSAMPWIDYWMGDRFVLTPAIDAFYHERLIRLDYSFLPGDRKRQIGRTPSRTECGLPEHGFVFASFNNAYKLNPVQWDCWMRIMRRVSDSVFWLVDDNVWATANLRAAASAAGIDPARLIFAPRATHADYLARLPLADLFLDNHPYNAGSTANDALWMGLPLLTLSGRTPSSRMGGSLLSAIGMPELITYNQSDYESKAIALAQDREGLRRLRERIARSRHESEAFDMQRMARQVEDLFNHIARPIVGVAQKA